MEERRPKNSECDDNGKKMWKSICKIMLKGKEQRLKPFIKLNKISKEASQQKEKHK